MTADTAAKLVTALSGFTCRVRIKEESKEPYSWSTRLIAPVPGYLESGGGPVSLRVLEWIEVATQEEKYIGRLVAPKRIDRQIEIEAALTAIGVPFAALDESIRIPAEPNRVAGSD
jgi:hypothetical protein